MASSQTGEPSNALLNAQQTISGVSVSNTSTAFVGTFNNVTTNASNFKDRLKCAIKTLRPESDPEADRAALISTKGERTKDTCEWIRDNENYKSWLNGDGSQVL
ncbi:hypothetical protein QQX98_006247 [Neonectria punicea]|uniref:Uncharacterized protein n=1 Tax=Neonectria punicea TaxID=979145 RepID=A0ABR1H1S1_9HYPO